MREKISSAVCVRVHVHRLLFRCQGRGLPPPPPPSPPLPALPLRYQDRGLPFCYVGYFDGMDEGVLRANVIEAKINDVAVKYEKVQPSKNEEVLDYAEGKVVPADRILQAAGFKVRGCSGGRGGGLGRPWQWGAGMP